MAVRPYDHPNNTVLREVFYNDAGSSSGTKVAKWRPVMTAEIDLVYGVVTDASAAASDTIVVYNGTTSIGGYAIGTATGTWTVAAADLSDATIASGAQVSIATFGTGASDVTYVYHVSDTNTTV